MAGCMERKKQAGGAWREVQRDEWREEECGGGGREEKRGYGKEEG